MYIKDYELIHDISVLFHKKIVIYGAGMYGGRTARLLEDIHAELDCFCDRSVKGSVWGYPVITKGQLKEKTNKEDCLVIIGSDTYSQEIEKELQEQEIDAYVCTWYGVQAAIELNVGNKNLPREFSEDLVRRKTIWQKNRIITNRDSVARFSGHIHAGLVYSPVKVGSTTMYLTLQKEGIEALHIHALCATGSFNIATGQFEYADAQNEDTDYLIHNVLRKNRIRPLKMVVSVREPVARAVSEYMEHFEVDFIWHTLESEKDTLEKNASRFVKNLVEDDYEFTWWFDHELKKLTGIDVYQYPFDRERGYAWIKECGIEILLLKMEKMDKNADVLGEFFEKPGITLIKQNVGNEKHGRYIYEGLKRKLKFPVSWLQDLYQNTERMAHFYTEEEKAVFIKKWAEKG